MTTSSYQFDVGKIVKVAYRQAALVGDGQTPTEDQVLSGIELLTLILKGTQAKGFFAKTVEFYNVTLATGIFEYNLPANLIDVIGPGMFIPPGYTNVDQATSELVVKDATREEWHLISNKGSQAQPTLYYAHRSPALVQVRLWPVPSSNENGGVIRFQTHRLRADVTDRSATVDAEEFWTEWLVYQLAADLSIGAGMSVSRIAMLEKKASDKYAEVRSMAKQTASMRIALDHRTSWSR